MTNLVNNAILKAKPGNEEKLKAELIKMLEPSRSESGCIQYTLHESVEPGVFVFYEVWEDEAALEFHMNTPHFKAYRENIASLVDSREAFRLHQIEQ